MNNRETLYPSKSWPEADARDVGMSQDLLDSVRRRLEAEAGAKPYRVAVVRRGFLIARWGRGIGWEEPRACASAAKSIYSSLLGIAVRDGVLPSADSRAADFYPRMLEVPEGSGPKPGRFVRDKDSQVTLRQLICNTSGYMKPGEEPGRVLNYQTYGMNVLTHALREAYGADSCGGLIEEKIRNPIGGGWTWSYTNFDLPKAARIDIFGNYTQINASPEDLCRLGWLWCNRGIWDGEEVIPSEWLESAVRSVKHVEWEDEKTELCYGSGFWTNDHGRLWPGLPSDGFAAYGAGEIAVVVFPSLELVIVESPGIFTAGNHQSDGEGLLRRVVSACVS